jgi:glutathione S-transferase
MSVLDLYQLPLSHYCEKARWALDFKGLEWRERNFLPGFHVKKARQLTGQTGLPILVRDSVAIHESSRILTHLDEAFPERPLTPDAPDLREQALEWKRFADAEIGIHVRRICYHELLQHPDLVIPLMAARGPWYGKWLLKRIFPQLQLRMRRYMNITADATQESRRALGNAVTRVKTVIQQRESLVGDRFTRADLAVAALLAPFATPAGYGLTWPAEFPPRLAEDIERCGPVLDWVRRIYAAHRTA